MLKEVIVKDFFSFKGETKIKLKEGVNLLLGINGSGKSSFINCLRILSEGVLGEGLVKLFQEAWMGFDEIVNCNGEQKKSYVQITYVFDYKKLNALNPASNFNSDVYYTIGIRKSGTSYTLDEKMYTQHQKKTDEDFMYLNFSNGNGRISTHNSDSSVSFQNYTDGNISGQELILRQINDPIHYLPINTLRKAIESMAVYNNFNVEEGSKVRSTTDFSTDIRLRKTGENLTQILSVLKVGHTFDFNRLEKTFRNINPNFKSIEIVNLYGKSYLSIIEKNMNRAIGALHISDGTLRFLLLESIFYNPQRGNIVAIDEPERGLHPDMIRSVAEMIKYAANSTQIIVATHSPHLLNQFELDDVLVFEKDEDNSTIVKSISEDDFSDWEGDYLPGQMWLLGQIGGKRR